VRSLLFGILVSNADEVSSVVGEPLEQAKIVELMMHNTRGFIM
jgi:hypothetical protein